MASPDRIDEFAVAGTKIENRVVGLDPTLEEMAVQDLPDLLATLFVAGEAGVGVAKFIAAGGEVGRGIGHGSVVCSKWNSATTEFPL